MATESISLFNEVLGPVMRGPSSSHTAGPYHIGRLARALLGQEPAEARFAFDPQGSFAQVFRQQGSDLGFAAGVLGWELTDERFSQALELAAAQAVAVDFSTRPLPGADHPNVVWIELRDATGRALQLVAKSIGGGAVVISELQRWPVHLTGDAYEVLVETAGDGESAARALLSEGELAARRVRGDDVLLHWQRHSPADGSVLRRLAQHPAVKSVWSAPPVFFPRRGKPLFASAAEMVSLADRRGQSLGQVALAYEAALLDLAPAEVLTEVLRRYRVMERAVQVGLQEPGPSLRLLRPSAGGIFRAEVAGRLAAGGLHARAATRAMAVMHVNGSGGVVCAAPTAGAAGVLPAVMVTLAELGHNEEQVALALLAAGAVGWVVATRATFAAEVAGCQVEIGAAGAMAAAGVVEAAGGSAWQAADAAAIAFQNTMGSVCDLVQGIVEIPCHTRNAVAASSAFVCADLVLGGYSNPVPLDETVDAVLAVGRMLPRELRCTALGGLAQAPSALALKPSCGATGAGR